MQNQRAFLDRFAKQHSIITNTKEMMITGVYITSHNEWYAVTTRQVRSNGGGALLNRYSGSLVQLLNTVYPEHTWNSYLFSRPHHMPEGTKQFSKTQNLLFQYLTKIFCDVPVLMNYTCSLGKNKKVEVDVSILGKLITWKICIPSFSLAFEYNGEYHYTFIPVYQYRNFMKCTYTSCFDFQLHQN